MAFFFVSKLAVPGVVLLISFLSYSSQILFLGIEPRPLETRELVQFNLLVVCIWICYARACMSNPGRVPADWSPAKESEKTEQGPEKGGSRKRWCRKCDALKPPRAHHCKICQRCIPKMDHHCPWTVNCVSHFTFPHFMRFLSYAVAAMTYLQYFLFVRGSVLWEKRNLPSYLGPSVIQLVHLLGLLVVNSLTLFLVGITFVRTLWALGGNVTTIESWEIERHDQLLRRARVLGGYLDGPDGTKVRIKRQEFPYDIGIWNNIKQGMNSGNPLGWLYPFAGAPKSPGLSFEVNGFEDPDTSWPPPDPDRMPRLQRSIDPAEAFTYGKSQLSSYEEIEAFTKRQQDDILARQTPAGLHRRRPFHARFDDTAASSAILLEEDHGAGSGEESWQDSGGNRLKDYGVDEDVEFYDEDDVPLAELLRRRKGREST